MLGEVWIPATGVYVASMLITGTGNDAHSYSASYVGGLHRYVRTVIAPAGSTTNFIAVLGLLGSPRETAIRAFTNYPRDFASVVWPSMPASMLQSGEKPVQYESEAQKRRLFHPKRSKQEIK